MTRDEIMGLANETSGHNWGTEEHLVRFAERLVAEERERGARVYDEPVAWMVYTLDGQSVCVTDNPADFTPKHRALPLYTTPTAAIEIARVEERERCARVCEEIEMNAHALWDRTADPEAQGRGIGAADCAKQIRELK